MEHKNKGIVQKLKVNKKGIGAIGEQAATVYLRSKGHHILGRNLRFKRGEIDILSKHKDTLHITEVKTAAIVLAGNNESIIDPEEKLSPKKRGTLKYLALKVLDKYGSRKAGEGELAVQINGIAIRIFVDSLACFANNEIKPRESIKKITARYYEAIA